MRNERRHAHTPPRSTRWCCAPSQAPVRGRTSSVGLLLFLRGYSPAAGLHGQRKGHPIGRYKHSHRTIVFADPIIGYPTSDSRSPLSH